MLPVLVWVVLFLLVGLLVYRCLVACGVELPLPGKGAAHFQSEEEQVPSCRAAATWKVFLAALGFRLGLLAVGLFAAMVLTSGESTFQDCFQRLCQRWEDVYKRQALGGVMAQKLFDLLQREPTLFQDQNGVQLVQLAGAVVTVAVGRIHIGGVEYPSLVVKDQRLFGNVLIAGKFPNGEKIFHKTTLTL